MPSSVIHVGKVFFFDFANSLYNFSITTEKYDVPCLKRLLEIRWTSHYDVTRCIVENEDEVLLSILSNIAEYDFATSDLST